MTVTGELPVELPDGAGVLDTLESLVEHYRAPSPDELGPGGDQLPPLHSGVIGYLGYDVVREVERLPDVPEDDRGWPDAVLSIIGELAAYDHWSQHATLIVSGFVADGADDETIDAEYDRALAALDRMAADGAQPLDEPLVEAPCRRRGRPRWCRRWRRACTRPRCALAKEYILSGDIFQVVLSQRFDVDIDADPLDVYRVLRRINPSPYMYYVREDELTLVGCSPEPMVQLLDDRVISGRSPAHASGAGPTSTTASSRPSCSSTPRSGPSTSCWSTSPATTSAVSSSTAPCGVDELMTLERYSHVMHLTSQVSGRAGRGPHADRRAPGDAARRARCRVRPRCGRWRSSTSSNRCAAVRTPVWSATSTSAVNIDTAIAIRTMVVDPPGPDGRRRASVQAGAGVVADSVPADEELETPQQGQGAPVRHRTGRGADRAAPRRPVRPLTPHW